MKPFHILLCLAFLLPLNLFAQSNYKSGYVVNLKGDTLKGFIDYREWDLNPDAIDFKSSLADNNSQRYSPGDIKYFNVDKLEAFASFTEKVSTDVIDPNKASEGRDTSSKVITAFFKVLDKGDRIALYCYKDEQKARYFVGESPGYEPKELVFRIYNNGAATEYTYRKQLSAVAVKYNELNDNLISNIGIAEYRENDLVTIVNKINHINKADFEKAHLQSRASQLFVGAVLNFTSYAPTGERLFNGNGSYTGTMPGVSAGINVFPNPNTQKLVFRFELMVDYGQFKTPYYSYNALQGSFIPQVLFNIYNAPNFKIFAGAGLGFDKYFYSNTLYQIPADFTTSGLAKAGMQFNGHWAITVQYLINSNGSRNSQIGLNYLF